MSASCDLVERAKNHAESMRVYSKEWGGRPGSADLIDSLVAQIESLQALINDLVNERLGVKK